MARTNVPLSTLTANGVIDIPAGTNVDPTNGHNIVLLSSDIPADAGSTNLFLYITNTSGADKTVTVRAGAAPVPAFRGGLGDLVVTAHTSSGGGLVGPLESARFAQSDGSINVDLAAGITGKITAFLLPERF